LIEDEPQFNTNIFINLPRPLPRRGVPGGFQGDAQAFYWVITFSNMYLAQILLPLGEAGRGSYFLASIAWQAVMATM
jgi:hypothetical protein